MKNQNLYAQTLILAILLFGCATNKDTDFLDLDSQGVEQTLNVDQKFLTKFKVEKKKELKKVPVVVEKSEKLVKKDLKKSDPKKPVEKIKPTEKITVKENPSKGGSESFSYPKDFPEAFVEYDKTSIQAWEKFQPKILVGEKFTFKVTYLGVTAGHIQMETLPEAKINGQPVYHFKARMRSARYYSYFYTLDDSLESFVSKEDFIPMKYVLLQRESAQKVDDLQLFDSDELLTYHFYKRLKRGKRKEHELKKPIPRYFQDSYSALYFVRGFPLKKGDRYEFPIVTRGKIWILKILVEGKEEIDVNGKSVLAIRLNAETRFPGVLEKKGDILFWYSADKLKKLLKFEAQVKIGSVEGELVDYTSGKSNQTL